MVVVLSTWLTGVFTHLRHGIADSMECTLLRTLVISEKRLLLDPKKRLNAMEPPGLAPKL